MFYRNSQKLFFTLFFVGLWCVRASAQVPQPPAAPPPDTLKVEAARRQTPQVVTIIHRLTGIKALALLKRNGEYVATIDDQLVTAQDAVTSITAGFVVGDGQNIIARLPQAEAEMEAVMMPSQMSWSYSTQSTPPTPPAPGNAVGYAPVAQPAEFVIVGSNGKQFAAKYVGLDGGSGLSLLRVNGLKIPLSRDVKDEQLEVGQMVRLFAPVRAARTPDAPQSTVSLRVGEIEGKITEIKRTSTGKIAHITVTAQKLSPAIVGGVALNEAGETIGIVEASDMNRARLIPASAVRRAAERVLTRRASVPRPWLGVRGEAVGATPLQTLFSTGWTEVEANTLKGHYQGILLTSVAPGTPAALADLRPGDVIVRVNNFEVKTPEDFSFVLNEAGSGATVNFTFFRGQWKAAPVQPTAITTVVPAPTAPPIVYTPVSPPARIQAPPVPLQMQPHVASVKLGESLDPARKMRMAEAYGTLLRGQNALPQVARGVEVVMLSNRAASHLGARGGLLVVFIDPESASARAGLRVFDVIETLDGKPLGRASWLGSLPAGNPQTLSLGVVRDRRRMEIKVEQKDSQK